MREKFFQALPYAMGVLIGVLMFAPPPIFEEIGAWRYLVWAVIIGLMLLASIGLQLALGLPKDPQFEVSQKTPSPEIVHLLRQFQAAGAEVVGPPLEVDLRPKATVFVLRHSQIGCWATVFETGTAPRKVSYDAFSEIEGGRGTVTTVADVGAAMLPLPKGNLKQLVQSAPPDRLLRAHHDALDTLRARGLRLDPPATDDLVGAFKSAMAEQRAAVLANPVKAAFLLLWRVATQSSPYGKPLAQQQGLEPKLQYLRGGGAPGGPMAA